MISDVSRTKCTSVVVEHIFLRTSLSPGRSPGGELLHKN